MARTEVTGSQIKDGSVDLAVDVTGILPVANGGTGSSTLALNSVLVGNGTGALQAVAPGAAGNVLTSNGTSWVSSAAAAGSGDVTTNTTTSVDSEVVLFSGTGGKSLKRATGSGLALLTSGVLSTVTAPSGAVVGTTDTQTLENKTLIQTYLAGYGTNIPQMMVTGSSANLPLRIFPKGNEGLWVANGATVGAVLGLYPPDTGVAARVQTNLTNSSLNLVSNGTGTVQINGVEAATVSGTQALTNKTLATPTITGYPGIIINNTYPEIRADSSGSEANIVLRAKGTSSGTVFATGSKPNTVAIYGAAADSYPAIGSTTGINLVTSGGTVQVNGVEAATVSGTQTLTNKTISGSSNTFSAIPQSAVTNLTSDLAGKEPTLTAGTTAQYYRGDKSWATLNVAAVSGAEATANKGQAGGYASLDGGGKVPVSQLPNAIMEYQGSWNASTNSPTLADGTGNTGDVYRVTVAASRNLGSGSIDFQVGDYAIYNGSVWEKADTTDSVASVNGYTGNVTLSKSDVGLGNVDNTSDATKNAATATLTNKTLTAPKISEIRDPSNSTVAVALLGLANAVNYPVLAGTATGVSPELAVAGTDANISLNLASKGSGTVNANGVPIVTTTGTQTLTNKTIVDPTINTSATITGSSAKLAFNVTDSTSRDEIVFNESSTTKAFLQWRGTTNAILPNTLRLQTQTASNADVIIGANAGNHLFIAGGQNSLTNGNVGIANTTPACALDVTGEIRASTAGTNTASVVTVGGTQTLTNKTLSAPTFTGLAPALNGAGIRFGHTNQTDGNDGVIAAGLFGYGLNIVGTQTTAGTGRQVRVWGTLMDSNDNAYATVNATHTFYNKTLDFAAGNGNTALNLPASATPNAGRLVCTTAGGGVSASNGPDTWAKIATFSTGINLFAEMQLLLGVTTSASGGHDTAIVSVYARSNELNSNPTCDVKLVSKGGGQGGMIDADSFKIIAGGWSSNIELWVKKGNYYGVLQFWEMSRANQAGITVTYHDGATWQAATPTGSVTNISTSAISLPLNLDVGGKINQFAFTKNTHDVMFSTATTGISGQGDGRIHLGYWDGSSFINYIRGNVTVIDSHQFNIYDSYLSNGWGPSNTSAGYTEFIRGFNDTGQRATHFINSSTRSVDGGANTYTIRNPLGSLRLGNPSYSTMLEGSALTFNGTAVPTVSSADTLSNKTLSSPTISGNHTVSRLDAAKLPSGTANQVYTTEYVYDGTSSVAWAPFNNSWTDTFRFAKLFGLPTYEIYTSGSWVSGGTCPTMIFDGRDSMYAQLANGTTQTAVRLTWPNSTGLIAWQNPSWLVFTAPYIGTGPNLTVLAESSANGTTWTTRHTSTITNAQANKYFCRYTDHQGDLYIRITFTITNSQPLNIGTLELLTNRADSYQNVYGTMPYEWDNERRITIGGTANTSGVSGGNLTGPRTQGVLNVGPQQGTTAAQGIYFGTDTNLYRSTTDTLKTDDNLIVAGNLTTTGTAAAGGVTVNTTNGVHAYVNADGATNVNLIMKAKGTGVVSLAGPDSNSVIMCGGSANAVNSLFVGNNVTGQPPYINAIGTDTDISIVFNSKGSGTVQANGGVIATTSTAQTLSNKTLSSPTINTPTLVSPNVNGNLWLTGNATLTYPGVLLGPDASAYLSYAPTAQYWSVISTDKSLVLGNQVGDIVISNRTANKSIIFGTGGTTDVERMRIASDGKVGIGITSPAAALDVTSSTSPTEVRIASTGGFGAARLSFYSDRGTASEWRPGYIQSNDAGNFTGKLDFYTNGTGSGNKTGAVFGMTVTNGKVGIANGSPSATLDVTGSVAASSTFTSTFNTASGLSTFNTAFSVLGNIHINNGAGSTQTAQNQAAITFQGSTANEAQAGIYVLNNGNTGTSMGFATTENYGSGPKLFLTATNTGIVNFPRATPTVAGVSLVTTSSADTLSNKTLSSPTFTGTANAVGTTWTGPLYVNSSNSLTNDYANAPLSIRERGLVANTQTGDAYSPHLNFHWSGVASGNLWMDSSGVLTYGGDRYGSANPLQNGVFRAWRFISTIATGTAPFTVNSTTRVDNLRAQYADSVGAANADNYANLRVIQNSNTTYLADGLWIGYANGGGSGTRIFGGDTSNPVLVTAGGTMAVPGALTGSSTIQGTRLISTVATGTAPLTVSSTTRVNNLNAQYYDGWDSTTLTASLRANRIIHGGGNITVSASQYVKWSQRYIVISNGRGTNFATNGYFDIDCPTSGTITGVGGVGDRTATANGIPLYGWEALYYILPTGSTNGTVQANFRVSSYTGDVSIGANWVLICAVNGDTTTYNFNNGIVLTAGETMPSKNQDSASVANALVKRDANGDFSARYGNFSYINMNHAAAERATDTIFYSEAYGDGYVRKNTLSGMRKSLGIVPRVLTTNAPGATPTVNFDSYDQVNFTGLATAITSMTTNLTGTPADGQKLMLRFKDNGTARAITWGASYTASGTTPLLTTTVASKTHLVKFIYDSAVAKWVCVACDDLGY